jgi:hypothetical protein
MIKLFAAIGFDEAKDLNCKNKSISNLPVAGRFRELDHKQYELIWKKM